MWIQTRFLYFIWKAPDFIVGQHTFIDSLLSKIGFHNVCEENRYPQWKETEMNEPFIEDKNVYLDDRGMLYEITRKSQTGRIEQVYITGCAPNVVKAWHLHKKQVDRFFVIKGTLLVAVYCEERKMLWRFILNRHAGA